MDTPIVVGDNQSSDAFGRLRVSSPVAQFEYQNQYGSGDLIWNTKVTGTGTYTHQPNTSCVLLSTGGTANGAGIIRQTKQYFRYIPGKSLLTLATFMFGTGIPNVRKRVGYFDDENGVFVQCNAGSISLVLRSKSSGSVVDNVIGQKDWNRDRLDGTGKSLQSIDWTKSQIFGADIQWLGVGSVRVGFEIGGQFYIAHEFEHSNLIQNTYMTTACLPIRYEVFNTGTAATSVSLVQICSTVVTEQGAIDDSGFYTHSASNGVTSISVTTRRNVLSIRPKTTINSIKNRARIEIENIEITVGAANIYWELVYNGTIGGTPAYNTAGANSAIEFDVAGTTVTGGEIIASGYCMAGAGTVRGLSGKQISSQYPLSLDIDGANPSNISLVCTSFSGTATVSAAINVKEFY